MGSLRVGHDWAASLSLFIFMHWRRKWQPTPVFLPGESQGWGSLWAAVYVVAQSRTQLKWLSSSTLIAIEFWKVTCVYSHECADLLCGACRILSTLSTILPNIPLRYISPACCILLWTKKILSKLKIACIANISSIIVNLSLDFHDLAQDQNRQSKLRQHIHTHVKTRQQHLQIDNIMVDNVVRLFYFNLWRQ